MPTSSEQRQQIIARLLAEQPDNIAEVAVSHWEKLADEIIAIVGEEGFAALFERSWYLAQTSFPWLSNGSSSLQPAPGSPRFVDLGERLSNHSPADACTAHSLLLSIFTDILASLIGEQLTLNILRTAWGNLASDTSGKELDNE